MNNRVFLFVAISSLVVTTLAGCNGSDQRFQEFSDRFGEAWSQLDRAAMLSLAQSITDEDIARRDGYRYYRLKVQAYQLYGENDRAYAVIVNHIEQFGDRNDVLLAAGYTAEWNGENGNPYFQEVLTRLSQNVEPRSEWDLMLEYVLRILLDEEIPVDLLAQLHSELEDDIEQLRQTDSAISEITVDEFLSEVVPPFRRVLISQAALSWAVSPDAVMREISEDSNELREWWKDP